MTLGQDGDADVAIPPSMFMLLWIMKIHSIQAVSNMFS
jgi:hypothetical protein